MRIVFFGSDDFALVNLTRLIASGYRVVAVVTPPDRPRGRGLKIMTSPVKDFARDHAIPVLQPPDLRDAVCLGPLRSLVADVFVVIAYGRFLPPPVLDIPKVMALNVHGSLLPKFRGAAPINWAIIRGETETGITIFRLNPRMDAGDIIRQERLPIHSDDTAVSLRLKMAALSADVLEETLGHIQQGDYQLTPQDTGAVTYAPLLKREHGQMDWSRPATELRNLVRGLLPWPAAFTTCQQQHLKVLAAEVVEVRDGESPGTVMALDNNGIVVSTGAKGLQLTRVQPASGKAMDAASYARGQRLHVGDRLVP